MYLVGSNFVVLVVLGELVELGGVVEFVELPMAVVFVESWLTDRVTSDFIPSETDVSSFLMFSVIGRARGTIFSIVQKSFLDQYYFYKQF